MSNLVVRNNEEDILSEIRKDGFYIERVEKTPERCILAVQQTGFALRAIPKTERTPELCLEAVKQTGGAIRYVSQDLMNKEICMEAVKNDGDGITIVFVPKEFRSSELYLEAVRKNGLTLRFIPEKERSEEHCTTAILQNGSALKYVPHTFVSKEICEKAVEQNGLALEFVPGNRRSKKLCAQAVDNNALALNFIPERFKSKELCELAVYSNWQSYLYIQESMYSPQACLFFLDSLNHKFVDRADMSSSDRSYIRAIVRRFPEEINSDPQIIKLERQLGVRTLKLKFYEKESGKFIVKEQIHYREESETVEFDSFADFYDYVDGDLENANLCDCDFLNVNLSDFNIEGALIRNDVLLAQQLYDDSFYHAAVREYGEDFGLMLSAENEVVEACVVLHDSDIDFTFNDNKRKIYYVSDIHINHKLIKRFPERATKQEILWFIRDLVRHMVDTATQKSSADYLLIAGDVSFNYENSVIFYEELAKLWNPSHIVVILGNHELWDFNRNGKPYDYSKGLDDIVNKYRELFSTLNICFLHNELLILKDGQQVVIKEEELLTLPAETLKEICLKSSLNIFGGLGFSGYSSSFNATKGIYRNTITSLAEDIEQTKHFENIYTIINNAISIKPIIVLTHTPKDNWNREGYNSQWIYVNGHTHRNEYCCSEDRTVYSDNQIGYQGLKAGLKHFTLSGKCDVFLYYPDGIHTITREQYIDFNRVLGINMTFNRTSGNIHMLKRSGIYCFIYENGKKRKLSLLSGGAPKSLEYNDLEYYFERMTYYSDAVKLIFADYYKALNSISNSIKAFGGSGNIHGCIVDIDFFNHVYLNPGDGTLTPYYAESMIDKYEFKNIKALLKAKRPDLHRKYEKLLKAGTETALQLRENLNVKSIEISQYVPETLMYGPSKIMRSLQYLMDVNVIRHWNDEVIGFFEKGDHELEKSSASIPYVALPEHNN
ncbi:DUF4116 domain-containing protein [Paenibacillus sp. B2(2019)]|uniref:DUF4116 domain-containing protein n=1 Tax=Paenibacillus sp. B2(2019) TaxID=2607754 RepID=UPI0011F350A1|nr:DUF4116 domain-containing protein [Paenibacillus sp. B2(2019)]KAA1186178.1 DUF4116 domain-containing protein [Paenibacillus sp. B2(2019)]